MKNCPDNEKCREDRNKWVVTRRRFLRTTAAAAAGMLLAPAGLRAKGQGPRLRFGLLTDSHYADLETWSNRHYRQSLRKMSECIELMNTQRVDFMFELGDFVNGAPENNLHHLSLVEEIYARFRGPRYHVLGNHDMDALSKEQFRSVARSSGIPASETRYSFRRSGIHFIVLDACFTDDETPYEKGNFHWTDSRIPDVQLEWLREELDADETPVIVAVHQLLDGDGTENYYVNNSDQVRRILERSGRVIAVLQGHQHAGQYSRINGIHYVTFRAMVEGDGEENNSYSILDLHEDGTLEITGYRMAESRRLDRSS